MKFPKMIKKYIKGVGMVEIRPYLTTNEIDAIINTIQTQTNDYAMRIMTMYSMVMPLCTNLSDFTFTEEEEKEVDIKVIEWYYLNGIFNQITKHIKGFDILVDGIKNLSISDIYVRFEGIIGEFTEQFKNINLDESMKKFETELDKLKEVNKEKEEILNG